MSVLRLCFNKVLCQQISTFFSDKPERVYGNARFGPTIGRRDGQSVGIYFANVFPNNLRCRATTRTRRPEVLSAVTSEQGRPVLNPNRSGTSRTSSGSMSRAGWRFCHPLTSAGKLTQPTNANHRVSCFALRKRFISRSFPLSGPTTHLVQRKGLEVCGASRSSRNLGLRLSNQIVNGLQKRLGVKRLLEEDHRS